MRQALFRPVAHGELGVMLRGSRPAKKKACPVPSTMSAPGFAARSMTSSRLSTGRSHPPAPAGNPIPISHGSGIRSSHRPGRSWSHETRPGHRIGRGSHCRRAFFNWLGQFLNWKTQSSSCKSQLSSCKTQFSNCKTQSSNCKSQFSNWKTQSFNWKTQSSSCKSQFSNWKTQSFNWKTQSSNCKTQFSNWKTQSSNCKSQFSSCKTQSFNWKTQSSNCKTQFSNCKTQSSNCKRQLSSCKSPASKSVTGAVERRARRAAGRTRRHRPWHGFAGRGADGVGLQRGERCARRTELEITPVPICVGHRSRRHEVRGAVGRRQRPACGAMPAP